MFRMVIVDDEAATREGLRKALDWASLDIEIVGEAANGEQALEIIGKTKPQILICDILMPKMDGIQLTNLIYQKNPDIQVLFLSGYSDKAFLKNAIRLRVVDYLFKPVDLLELIQAIEKCKQSYLLRPPHAAVHEDDALRLLSDDPIVENELPLDFSRPVFSLIIRIQPHSTTDSPVTVFDSRVIISHYSHAFRTTLQSIFGSSFVVSSAGLNYVVHANCEENEWKSAAQYSRLASLLNVIPDQPISIAIGRPGMGRPWLKESFRQARSAADASFLLGYGHLIWIDDVKKSVYQPPKNLRQTLQSMLTPAGIPTLTAYIEALIDDMRGCDPCCIPQIRETLTELSLCVFQYINSVENTADQPKPITDILSGAPSILTIRSILIEALEKTYQHQMLREQKGKIVYAVEQYVQQNIMSPLSVKEIARSVYVSPNYLCYLYKAKTGKTLMEFILENKMHQARKLLLETDLSVGEISEMLGYSSQSYFSRRFYSRFHQTPSDYRSRNAFAGKEFR